MRRALGAQAGSVPAAPCSRPSKVVLGRGPCRRALSVEGLPRPRPVAVRGTCREICACTHGGGAICSHREPEPVVVRDTCPGTLPESQCGCALRCTLDEMPALVRASSQ